MNIIWKNFWFGVTCFVFHFNLLGAETKRKKCNWLFKGSRLVSVSEGCTVESPEDLLQVHMLGTTLWNSLSGVILTHWVLENLWARCAFSVAFLCIVFISQQALSNSVYNGGKLDWLLTFVPALPLRPPDSKEVRSHLFSGWPLGKWLGWRDYLLGNPRGLWQHFQAAG